MEREIFDYITRMVEEASSTHGESTHVLCAQDEYARYIMRADWLDGAPVVYITYDDVNSPTQIYSEVLDTSNTQALNALIAKWQEIGKSFAC